MSAPAVAAPFVPLCVCGAVSCSTVAISLSPCLVSAPIQKRGARLTGCATLLEQGYTRLAIWPDIFAVSVGACTDWHDRPRAVMFQSAHLRPGPPVDVTAGTRAPQG